MSIGYDDPSPLEMVGGILFALFLIALSTCMLPACAVSEPKVHELPSGLQIHTDYTFAGITYKTEVKKLDAQKIDELERELKRKDLRHNQAMRERDREQDAKDYSFGSWMKRGGWILLALGFAAHACSSFGPLKSWASSIMTLGFFAVIAGIGLQKTIEMDTAITIIIVVPAGIYLLYKARKWSVSHWFKGKIKRKKLDNPEPKE